MEAMREYSLEGSTDWGIVCGQEIRGAIGVGSRLDCTGNIQAYVKRGTKSTPEDRKAQEVSGKPGSGYLENRRKGAQENGICQARGLKLCACLCHKPNAVAQGW